MAKKLYKSNSSYFLRDEMQESTLKPYIYNIDETIEEELFLNEFKEKFDFPYKVYGLEEKFINRIVKTYNNSNTNLGVLFNGVKGTGKTVSAEVLCNKLNLPVILVTKNSGKDYIDKLKEFLSGIPYDLILFFDEFEKIFPHEWGKAPELLSFLDGIHNTKYRRVFLMTTNEIKLNDNYLERPSRILYIKSFDDCNFATINEIIDDLLIYKQYKEECIEFISSLNIITIDIIKSVVREINIHNETPSKFAGYFNVKISNDYYDVYEIKEGKEELIAIDVPNENIFPNEIIKQENIGKSFQLYGEYQGQIKKIIDKSTFIVSYDEKIKTYKLELKNKKHRSFNAF